MLTERRERGDVVQSDCLQQHPSPSVITHKPVRKPEMIEKVVRCPYCVLRDNFREMFELNQRFVCRKCGHVAIPADPEFKCPCRKCWELSFAGNLGPTRVS